METINKTTITVEAIINAPIKKAWNLWTIPEHITKWNYASDDWHSTKAENDLRKGGKFSCRMEAKDGSSGFDFEGVYEDVRPYQLINYKIGDGREVNVIFEGIGSKTKITETFEAEQTNPIEMQHGGWQSILNNFKKYAESVSLIPKP